MTTASDNPRITGIRQHIHTSYDELQRLIAGRLSSLPAQQLYETSIPDEWSIMENLAHIVEFMPYWADEVAKLVVEPGRNFGRTHQDEARLRAISEHKLDTLQQINAALPGSYEHMDRVLSNLRDSDLDLTGRHIKFGERTLDRFIEDFITQHLANHNEQLQSAIAALESENR